MVWLDTAYVNILGEPLIYSCMGAIVCAFSPRGARSEDRTDVDPRPTKDNARGGNRPVPMGLRAGPRTTSLLALPMDRAMGAAARASWYAVARVTRLMWE